MTRKRMIPALILSLCILFLFAGCDLPDPFGSGPSVPDDSDITFENIGGMSFRYSPYYTPVTCRYAYEQLEPRQRELYDAVLSGVWDVSPERYGELNGYPMKRVRIPGKLSIAQMRVTFRALINDNPYLFWLSQSFSHVWDPEANCMEVVAYASFSPAQLRVMLGQADAALDAFFACVPEGLSAYEREKIVHDYVIDRCDYDDEIAGQTAVTDRSLKAHGVWGVLADHRAVCEGYGMTVQLLLNGLGVECVTLTGTAYNSSLSDDPADAGLHLWDAVRLDGAWYHVDPTWDDQTQAMRRYEYFNLSTDAITEDHTLSELAADADEERIAEEGAESVNLFIPVCDRTDYNYYVYEYPHLDDDDGSGIKDALLRAAEEREPVFTFYIDPAYREYGQAIRMLFRDTPQAFFRYIEEVNRSLDEWEIDRSNLVYYMNPRRGVVSVELRYY